MMAITNFNNGTYRLDAPIPTRSEQEALKIARSKVKDPNCTSIELEQAKAICAEMFTKCPDWCHALSAREKGGIAC